MVSSFSCLYFVTASSVQWSVVWAFRNETANVLATCVSKQKNDVINKQCRNMTLNLCTFQWKFPSVFHADDCSISGFQERQVSFKHFNATNFIATDFCRNLWIIWHWVFTRVHLPQARASKLWELCNDASDTVLIENNGVTRKWVATPFWSDSIVFSMRTGLLASSQSGHSIYSDAWCKQILILVRVQVSLGPGYFWCEWAIIATSQTQD